MSKTTMSRTEEGARKDIDRGGYRQSCPKPSLGKYEYTMLEDYKKHSTGR